MKKIMLLGDSIRLSYQATVQELLAGQAQVEGPIDNCRFAHYTLFNLGSWLADAEYDLIHWNNGQWDTCYMLDGNIHTPLGDYVALQLRIAAILRSRAKRLIFATTTPVRGDMFAAGKRNHRNNTDISAYNLAAAAALRERGVEINDLYTPVLAQVDSCIGADHVHLTPAGVQVCAQVVSAAVMA